MITRDPSCSPVAPDSQSALPAGPVTAADISAFLHRLARLRSPARHDNHEDHAERVSALIHKAELFDRIADQHTGTDQAHARQIAQRARDAAAEHIALVHPTSPTRTPR